MRYWLTQIVKCGAVISHTHTRIHRGILGKLGIWLKRTSGHPGRGREAAERASRRGQQGQEETPSPSIRRLRPKRAHWSRAFLAWQPARASVSTLHSADPHPGQGSHEQPAWWPGTRHAQCWHFCSLHDFSIYCPQFLRSLY